MVSLIERVRVRMALGFSVTTVGAKRQSHCAFKILKRNNVSLGVCSQSNCHLFVMVE